jgi:hypothetical protein
MIACRRKLFVCLLAMVWLERLALAETAMAARPSGSPASAEAAANRSDQELAEAAEVAQGRGAPGKAEATAKHPDRELAETAAAQRKGSRPKAEATPSDPGQGSAPPTPLTTSEFRQREASSS